MGATKLYVHGERTIDLALITRAIAHPARIRIVELARENSRIRNKDLSNALELNKKTIYDHLLKLKESGLVNVTFYPNCYHIELVEERFDALIRFLTNI